MLNTYLSNFVGSWVAKANRYKRATLSGAFDRFFSLFVPFNSLYQAAVDKLISEGRVLESEATDRKSATIHTIEFLGAELLEGHLKMHCRDELQAVVKLIEDGTFYVSTNRKTGMPDHNADKLLIDAIKSGEGKDFCEGIMNLLYLTRCNMFHGSKEFTHIQIKILVPLSSILAQVIQLLLARFHTEA